MSKKKKINTSSDSENLETNPFGNLDFSNLELSEKKTPQIRIEKETPKQPPKKRRVDIKREKSGRGGKTVTVIEGISASGGEKKAILKLLQASCGSGGTIKHGNIEIQGDKRQEIAKTLQNQGYRTVFSGG